ncbi:DUF4184 family protein [Actinokineospora sp. PR83]|uniref:DUF4184 family protein n=1 Tax=Actinokineospora sp. PR83 TaxID=2884908 RepID=UPI001F39C6D6|nr:DUF4184 family protein [Actinokineospora sp. PR83]MCG8917148.1 DUF4184 family protein [Actinokineospora sp. PR83]
MPFTLAHPAAVLPLARKPLVASGLVVGSLSPDLTYFVALRPLGGDFTHSPLGLVVVDLPLALALLALFHAFAVPALVSLAPQWVRERVVAVARPPRPSPVLVVSVLVGGVTHLVWDAFTHHDGFAVVRLPWLAGSLWTDMPVYQFLQLGSSVAGMAVVLWWCARYLRGAEPAPVPARFAPARRPWLPVTGVVVAAGALAAGNALRGMANVADQSVVGVTRTLAAGVTPTAVQVQTGLILASIGAVTGVFLGLLAYGVVRRRRLTSPR